MGLRIVAGVSEVASLACMVALWRGSETVMTKVLWTALLLAPFVGPLFYAVWHDPPPPSDPIDRPPEVHPDGL